MHSLRLKLIGWFLLVLGIVIISFSLIFYFTKQRSLYSNLDQELYSRALLLSNQLELDKGGIKYKNDEFNPSASSIFIQRIIKEDGTVISQTPIPRGFSFPKPDGGKNKILYQTLSASPEQNWRIVQISTLLREEVDIDESEKTAKVNSETLIIQCGESLKETNEKLGELSGQLITIGLITFILAATGSFFLAGRVLQPIRNISKTLEGISETNLSSRIQASDFDQELHPLVLQLNGAFDRLEKAFQRERQFTADASHELRTPLTVIMNNIEVLLKRPRQPEEYLDVHQANLRTVQQMQNIIEGLLALSRIDAGQIQLQKKSFPLNELIEEILMDLKSKATAKQVSIHNQVPNGINIHADYEKLKQALVNLIDNAILYNRPGGAVTIQAQPGDSHIEISIADTGIGIPPESLPRIFERFYRVDASRTESTGGCGLGLAIAKSLLVLHQGTIIVSSSPQGSIFTLTLPRD